MLTTLSAIFLVSVALFIQYTKTRKVKGKIGESLTAFSLLARLPKDEYEVFNNLTFVFPDGYTSQIDHIVVSKYGIFIIETKHYKRVYPKNYRDFFAQNAVHCRHFAQRFEVPASQICSLVCVLGTARFPTGRPDFVLAPNDLISHIKRFRETIVSPSTVARVSGICRIHGKTTTDKTSAHLARVSR